MLTRLYQVKLYQCQPSLIKQSSTKTNQALLGNTVQWWQPGLIRHISTNANQALLGKAFTSMSTRPHWVKFSYQRQPGPIRQSFYICTNQTSLDRAPYWRQLGLIEQSFHINANQIWLGKSFFVNTNQVSLGKVFTSNPTKPYQVELLHQCQIDFIRLKFHINTNQAWLGRSFYINVNHTLLGTIFSLMPIRLYWVEFLLQRQFSLIRQIFLHLYVPGLIRQSFQINANQDSLWRAFTSTLTRFNWAELFISTLTRLY